MKQYIKTAQQNRLLSLLFDTSTLTLLRSRTGSCIQMVSFKGIKALKSIQDSNRKIRIVLISFLTKIHLHYSPQNQSRLSTLKNIIYTSRQESITQQRGIVREQLLKMMAQQITGIEIRNDVQIQILKMFNNVPFFDEVLINAIKEANPLICDNDCQIAAWLDRELEIKVNINQDALIDEGQGEMFLVGLGEQFHASKDCKSSECKFKGFRQYMRFSSQICTIDFDNQTHEVYDRKTRGQMFSRLIFEEQPIDKPIGEVNQNLYDTVLSSSVDLSNSKNNSPNIFSKARKNKEPQSVGLFDSAISQTMDQKKNGKASRQNEELQVGEYVDSEYEDGKKTIKVKRRSKKNKQGSALWNILCCNF